MKLICTRRLTKIAILGFPVAVRGLFKSAAVKVERELDCKIALVWCNGTLPRMKLPARIINNSSGVNLAAESDIALDFTGLSHGERESLAAEKLAVAVNCLSSQTSTQ